MEETKRPAYRWVMFFLALLITLITSMEMLLPSPLITTIMQETGWSTADTGSLVSVISLLMGIFIVIGSPIMDRLGYKATCIASLAVMSFGGILPFFIGESYLLHYLARLIFGIGYGASLNAAPIAIGMWFSPKEQPLMQGIRVGVSFLGFTLTYAVVLPIYNALQSWQNTFGVVGLFVAATGVIWLLLCRVPPAAPAQAAPAGEAQEEPGQQKPQEKQQSGLARAVRTKETWFLAVGMLGMVWSFNTMNTYLPTYLAQVKGLEIEAASGATGILTAVGILIGIGAGYLSSALGRRKILGWPVMLASLIGSLMVVLLDFGPLSYLGIALSGFAGSGYAVMFSTVPTELPGSDEKLVNAMMGMIIASGYIPAYFMPQVFSALTGSVGMQMAMLLCTSAYLISIPPLLMIRETGPKGRAA